MKRFLFPLIVGVLLLTLQTTLLMSLPIQRIRPDLVLVLVLYLGFSYPPVSGGILTFFLGYLMDLLSGNALGLYTLTRPLIFYIAQFSKGRFYLESPVSQFLFVFGSALAEGMLILGLLSILNPAPAGHLLPLYLTYLLPQAILTGLIAPLLFPLFNQGLSLLLRESGTGVKER